MKKLIFILLTCCTICFAAETYTYKIVSITALRDKADVIQAVRVIFFMTPTGKAGFMQKGHLTKDEVVAFRNDASTVKGACERIFAERTAAYEKSEAAPASTDTSIDPAIITVDTAKIAEKVEELKSK